MSELYLEVSEKFYDEADSIRAELSKHLKVSQPSHAFRKSADPSQASLIQLLGEAEVWLALKAAAALYLGTLVKRAADATWDKIVNKDEVKPITDVATTLATAAERVDGKVRISFGLNIPSDYIGTSISIESSDPEKVAHVLSCFIVHTDQLSKDMQAEVAAGRRPRGPATIELQDDESLMVRWQTRDGRAQELQIPRPKS